MSGPRRSSLPIGVTSMMPTFSLTFRASAAASPYRSGRIQAPAISGVAPCAVCQGCIGE